MNRFDKIHLSIYKDTATIDYHTECFCDDSNFYTNFDMIKYVLTPYVEHSLSAIYLSSIENSDCWDKISKQKKIYWGDELFRYSCII